MKQKQAERRSLEEWAEIKRKVDNRPKGVPMDTFVRDELGISHNSYRSAMDRLGGKRGTKVPKKVGAKAKGFYKFQNKEGKLTHTPEHKVEVRVKGVCVFCGLEDLKAVVAELGGFDA